MSDLEIKQTEVDGVMKFSMNFPLTDETGQPILDRQGKPRVTNILGDTVEELATKVAQSFLESARTLERANRHIDTLKNRKPTARRPDVDLKAKPLSQEETIQVGLDIQDPRKAAAAVEKVLESRIGPVAGEVERQRTILDIEARREVARQFFNRHPEYNLSANGAMLANWLLQNNFEFTLENIEIAFATLQDQLALKQAPRNDPPPRVPEVPGNAAPGNEPQNPGNPPPPTRRAPVGGLRDSQASARPDDKKHFPYTRDQLLKMAYSQNPKYDELIRNPVTNVMVNEVLAGR